MYFLGIATKDAPNMCHGYVALLGSDDQVLHPVLLLLLLLCVPCLSQNPI